MTHAPRFWAEKLPDSAQRSFFWALVEGWNFSGETAYCKTIKWFDKRDNELSSAKDVEQ